MKRFLILGAMLFLGSTARAQHVQQCTSSNVTGSAFSTVSCALPQPTTAGNVIAIGVTYGGNPAITASDSLGNPYSVICKAFDPNHNQSIAFLRATSIAAGPADKVTVNFSSAMAYLALGVHEYAGINAASPDGGCITNVGASGQPSTAQLTTTAAATLFSVAVEDSVGSGDTFTPPGGFALRANLGSAGAYADAEQVAVPSGTTSVSWALAPTARDRLTLLAALNTGSAKPSLAASASLTWDDGTPVAGKVSISQLIPTSATTSNSTALGTFSIDATGHISGNVAADLSQADPLSFFVQLADANNVNMQTASFNVPKAMFPATIKGLSAAIILSKTTSDIKTFQISLN